jgi:endonuclease YncB( thermonuclease family)
LKKVLCNALGLKTKSVTGRDETLENVTFENDNLSRKVAQYFLLLQIAAMVFVFILIANEFYSLALGITFITLLLFIGILTWLYLRYQGMPVVKEKRSLQQAASQLQNSILKEANTIRATKKKRETLSQDEQKEKNYALRILQQNYLQNGLSTSYIKDAKISGVGPKLKERLATYRITTAAHISNKISEIPGIGEAKRLALTGWRSVIYAQLERTKPIELPYEQLEIIGKKYQALHEQNDINERNAQENQLRLNSDLSALQPRLKQLKPITFTNYLGKSLASQGYVAALIAFILVTAQTVSGMSATTSALIASIPTPTVTSTITPTSTNTSTPTITLTSTITLTPSMTNTPTITPIPLPAEASCIPPTDPQIGKVVEVIDGDTIRVTLEDGLTYSVRYIGMDTPENTSAKEYFGTESTAKNRELVQGQTITLYRDVSETDRYGRLLRYVVVGNIFVNYELVAQGYATQVSYPPDVACQSAFRSAQQTATISKLGLWTAPTPTLIPIPASGGGVENPVCICTGNAYNCADFGSHSAAQSCYNYCNSKGAGDVHKLDRDADGIACETLP